MLKRKMVSLLLAASIILSFGALAGCGSSSSKPGESKASSQGQDGDSPKEKVNITYWHIFPEGDVFKPVHDELIKRFNESQDSVHVEDLGISFFDFLSKMDTAIPAGTGPDVAFYDLVESQRRAEAGVLVDLNPYIEAENYDIDQFYAWTKEVNTFNGHWYGLPFSGGGRFLVYNKAMFREAGLDPEAPPKTLAQLEEYADKLTKVKDNGEIEVLGFHPSLGNASMMEYVVNRGNKFFEDDGTPILNSQENLETLEWYVRMTNKYGAKKVQSLQAASKTTGIDPLLAGFVAMEVNVADFYKKLSESDIEYGVCKVPGVDENQRGTQGGSFDLEIFDHGDKARADASWEFIKFMTNAESQQYWASENKWPSSNQKAMESGEEFKTDPVWKVIIAEAPYARILKYQPKVANWWNLLAPEVEAAQLEQKSPKQALDDAQAAVELAIENYDSMN